MTLDEIRAELVTSLERAREACAEANISVTIFQTELRAHDRAVAAMPNVALETAPAVRAPQRDIAALVRAEQERDFGQTIDQIAARISARPSQVAAALDRIAKEPTP